MFFLISKIEQAIHHTDGLQNPKNPSNLMIFRVYRTQCRTAFFTVYSKKAYGEFWDDIERKKISSNLWSSTMKEFAIKKVAETSKPPFVFKFTIVGWIFIMMIIFLFGFLIYDSVKPPIPKSVEYVSMKKAPVEGDVYFGHFESFKNAGERIASNVGFGWFKVVKVEGDVYYIAKASEMSKNYKPKEQLNSADFEVENTSVKIIEQSGYMINLKAIDGKMEIYITDKK